MDTQVAKPILASTCMYSFEVELQGASIVQGLILLARHDAIILGETVLRDEDELSYQRIYLMQKIGL